MDANSLPSYKGKLSYNVTVIFQSPRRKGCVLSPYGVGPWLPGQQQSMAEAKRQFSFCLVQLPVPGALSCHGSN